MIITIANQTGGTEKSMLADSLAALRTQTGRRVLLLDNDPKQSSIGWCAERNASGISPAVMARAISGKGMQPELENLGCRFQDIVIDTEARDSLGSRSALIAAGLVIVALDSDQFNVGMLDAVDSNCFSEDKLTARIATARELNPSLRILVVITYRSTYPTFACLDAVRQFVANIPCAEFFARPIHADAVLHQAYQEGLAISECADQQTAQEIQDLYSEVFGD
ncbi:chromosome partitioning protein [Undibacterium sp. GrIS 1.2]|uniref:nucleotide-binding protein n=1 Tax=Undibacterium sp. GrIS 1.2 TaxID=3143933 RepID=UPI003399FE77